ncbi:hypothetical protein Tco_1091576 [Tanacetum coccineum]|uniref:F-box protein n=1 Tax=Tanacetum coccineum TaxID=301880 RepID=A0ABQ5I7J6_9ASTR
MKMEILLEETSNKLMVEHVEFDESDTYVLERLNTSAGNPVQKILLKLNLPDHRILKDGGEEFSPKNALWKTSSLLPALRQLRISRLCSLEMVCLCVLDQGGLTAIYLNGALHWLQMVPYIGLKHYKLNIEDHDHLILTSIQIHHGLHWVRDYYDFREFTIYEMRKGCFVWSVREKEEDSCLVINLSGKVVEYNIISKSLYKINDIGSNQLDDNRDDDELITPFEADHNFYEFILSFASV